MAPLFCTMTRMSTAALALMNPAWVTLPKKAGLLTLSALVLSGKLMLTPPMTLVPAGMDGMEVTEQIDRASFVAALQPVMADYGKKFGTEIIAAIQDTH